MDDQTMDKAANDHDLLIELRAWLKIILQDVKELKTTMTAQITAIDTNKLDKEEANQMHEQSNKLHEDHEKRIRAIERWVWLAIGGLAVLQIVMSYLK